MWLLRRGSSGQGQTLSSLRKDNASLKAELHEVRQKRKEMEAAERAWKDAEYALKEEVKTLQELLDRSRRDME